MAPIGSKRFVSVSREIHAELSLDRPDLDLAPVVMALENFSHWRGRERSLCEPPVREELQGYLADNSETRGPHVAVGQLFYIQAAAPVLWGMPFAALIARLIRSHRCEPKNSVLPQAERVRRLISRLPDEHHKGLLLKMGTDLGGTKNVWSLSYLEAVSISLLRWTRWCESLGHSVEPTGTTFWQYAGDLEEDGVSARSITDYLVRIMAGYRASYTPGFTSTACDHVTSLHRARAKRAGSPTKTRAQLVGASTIYDLGCDLIEGARARGPRGLHQARDYRNGLLLMLAAAVPQRARAMSHFDIGQTVILLDHPHIRIRLPGSALKLREHKKGRGGYDRVIENSDLWNAIDGYQRTYRPFFDDGTMMFPSLLDIGSAISSKQIGVLTGNLTERHLGVRVSVHRVRDNVATEASEELQSGGYIAPALLDHKSATTTMASYDHAQGVRAARDHSVFIAARRSYSAELKL
ncbi:hypothetical protein [Arenibacterium halophilum]|uniref:Tyr recombinase domain-containing protein n=1 Tax=Arenibacterium halophilum TaxID=2583821 RepID=A0ABY2XC40_9RHOB|nr:hypothetical protein [Arenibacterium halophilum]TMV14587.1 hypothetical protein FGK64_00945 [Arenibacterium halophilum]